MALTLRGDIQDPRFLLFLEQVAKERSVSFTTQNLLVLDHVYREEPVPENLKPKLQVMYDEGLLERIGKGRGVRYILAKRFYTFLGKKGAYTRKRGLDRDTNKALLLKHLQQNNVSGSKLGELRQVLPTLTLNQVQTLLLELKSEENAYVIGRTRAASWYPGKAGKNIASD